MGSDRRPARINQCICIYHPRSITNYRYELLDQIEVYGMYVSRHMTQVTRSRGHRVTT